MVRKFNFNKDSNNDMGFVLSCLSAGLINFDQLKEWLFYVIEQQDDYPTYFFDIIDLEDRRDFYEYEVIGYSPSWGYTDKTFKALRGIGYKRWPDYKNDGVSRKVGLKHLEANPHIETRFRETFPFIEW